MDLGRSQRQLTVPADGWLSARHSVDRRSWLSLAAVCSLTCGAPQLSSPAVAATPLPVVSARDLTVESGHISFTPLVPLSAVVDGATTRAVLRGARLDTLELTFVYRGATDPLAPLASGELRQQVGLKLRALDTCNVLYVMWRIAPTAGIHVELKSNFGLHTHEECRDRGYTPIAARWTAPMVPILPGVRRRLMARLRGTDLSVRVDGRLVWRGAIPLEALEFDGPWGIRSDNARFEFDLAVPPLR
jgi:hypothetical protein